jgi:exonuclease III
MKPRIVSWNVRGLNDVMKCKGVGNLLRGWKADLVCLQETKVSSISRALVRRVWGGSHVKWCSLEAVGASGGILILWDSRVMEMEDSCIGSYSLSVLFRNVEDGVSLVFYGVYGPNDDSSRRILWD